MNICKVIIINVCIIQNVIQTLIIHINNNNSIKFNALITVTLLKKNFLLQKKICN